MNCTASWSTIHWLTQCRCEIKKRINKYVYLVNIFNKYINVATNSIDKKDTFDSLPPSFNLRKKKTLWSHQSFLLTA